MEQYANTTWGRRMATETAIQIILNGEATEHPADTTVADFLRTRGLDPTDPKGIAVAVNDEVVRSSEWDAATLRDGDRVEVITARQGG